METMERVGDALIFDSHRINSYVGSRMMRFKRSLQQLFDPCSVLIQLGGRYLRILVIHH